MATLSPSPKAKQFAELEFRHPLTRETRDIVIGLSERKPGQWTCYPRIATDSYSLPTYFPSLTGAMRAAEWYRAEWAAAGFEPVVKSPPWQA